MATKGRKAIVSNNDDKIGGFSVYRDDKNRPIYYNRFNHNGYVLSDNAKLFKTFNSRFMLGFIATIFGYIFNLPLWLCVTLGIIVYLVMEFKFRKFLNKLPVIPNFQPKKRTSIVDSEAGLSTKKIITKMILYFTISILLIVNAYSSNYTGLILYLNYALSVITFITGIIEIRAFIANRNK